MPNVGTPFPPVKTSRLALWSFVLGILSIFPFSFLTGIPAVICGQRALTQIKSSDTGLKGAGLARSGVATGCVGCAIAVLCLLVFIALRLSQSRFDPMAAACISNLRLLQAAKEQWALEPHHLPTDIPTAADIQPYLGHGAAGELPSCPEDPTHTFSNSYDLRAVTNPPICKINPNHQLP